MYAIRSYYEKLAKDKGISVQQAKDDFFTFARPSSIIRRFATVEEVASHAAYLCSPLASATTGAAHRVDGGVVDTCF